MSGAQESQASQAAQSQAAQSQAEQAAAAAAAQNGSNPGQSGGNKFQKEPLKQIWRSYLEYGSARNELGLGKLRESEEKINSFFLKVSPTVFENIFNDQNKLKDDSHIFHKIANAVNGKPLEKWHEEIRKIDDLGELSGISDKALKQKCKQAHDELFEIFEKYNDGIRKGFQDHWINDEFTSRNVAISMTTAACGFPFALLVHILGFMYKVAKSNVLSASEKKALDQAIKECQSVKPDINSNIDLTSKPSESELVLTSSPEELASTEADLYKNSSSISPPNKKRRLEQGEMKVL